MISNKGFAVRYCKRPDDHRLYHVIGQKCPCYIEWLKVMAQPISRPIGYNKLLRELVKVDDLDCADEVL